jgi:hypothetical protein
LSKRETPCGDCSQFGNDTTWYCTMNCGPPVAHKPIFIGRKGFIITSVRWDGARQVGVIQYESDDGSGYETEALGTAPNELRQAVLDDASSRFASR